MAQRPRSHRIRRSLRMYLATTANVAAVFLAVSLPIAMTLLAWQSAKDDSANEARTRFAAETRRITDAIGGRMLDYEQVLLGTAGLFAASTSVDRDEFRAYYRMTGVESHYPGIQALAYAPVVTREKLPALIADVRASGLEHFDVSPAGERPEYAPVIYVEPFAGRNLRALGFDMRSEPTRRAAMEASRNSGEAAISGKVTLVQEISPIPQPGVLLYVPVFRNGRETSTLEQRRAAIAGYVIGAFRVNDLMRGIVGHVPGIALKIMDHSGTGDDNILHDSLRLADTELIARKPRFTATAVIDIHGRKWTARMSSLPEFEATIDTDKPRLVLAGGAAISILLLLFMWTLARTNARATALARRMSAEASARRSELEAVNDASPLGIYRTDAAGNVNYVNRMYEILSGRPAATAMSAGWLSAFHPDDRGRAIRSWEEMLHSGTGHSGEYRLQRPDGSIVWVNVNAAPIREDGRVTGYTGTFEDVTARRQAEREVRAGRELLALALEGSNLALFDWNLATGAVRLSERWNVMLGGAPEPTVITIHELEQVVHHEDLPALRNELRDVLKGASRFYEIEHRVRTHRGGWLWILSRAKVVERDESGRALRVTGTNADITDRKEIESLKNEFIATVSHELRTPLTSIVGALDLLKETAGADLPPQAATFLDMAIGNSDRLAALVNDVLDIEKIEAGKAEFDLKPVRIDAFLEHALKTNEIYAQRFGVAFRLKQPVPDVAVLADDQRLMQVVTNLLSNAAKFSPHGQIVSVAATRANGRLRVSVTDRGAGIPEAFRGRIFSKFAQADSSDIRARGGTGLGLAICKALIERMNGEIGFESEVGRGTTFHFELPLAPG